MRRASLANANATEPWSVKVLDHPGVTLETLFDDVAKLGDNNGPLLRYHLPAIYHHAKAIGQASRSLNLFSGIARGLRPLRRGEV
jgi:hypothetical protein